MFCINQYQLDLIKQVDILWVQHSEWTYMSFMGVVFKNSNEKDLINRLLRNPVDFGCFLRGFYGDRVACHFTNLLTEHLQLAISLVRFTMAGATMEAEQINKRLYENADEISLLLATINPYWYYPNWRDMFYLHLDLAKEMAGQMIEGNYRESIETYDKFEAEVMMMADMMARGILKEFF